MTKSVFVVPIRLQINLRHTTGCERTLRHDYEVMIGFSHQYRTAQTYLLPPWPGPYLQPGFACPSPSPVAL